MEVKKEKKLRTSFIGFVVKLIFVIALIIIIDYYLIFTFGTSLAYPANYSERVIQNNSEQLKEKDKVTEDLITPMSSFGIYSNNGDYLYGNFNKEESKKFFDKYKKKEMSLGYGSYLKNIQRKSEIVLIKYPLTAQYKSQMLRTHLPNIELTLLAVFLLEIILVILILSNRFAKKVTNDLAILLIATEKIEEDNLNFDLKKSRTSEINRVLEGIHKLKSSLKVSLQEQWQVEQRKREQISALAHDIKSPLTIVKGNIELLKETNLTTDQEDYCDYIEESSQKMENYIQNLLLITKDEEDSFFLEEYIFISELFNSLMKQGEALARTRESSLLVKTSIKSTAFIKGNKDELERALMNILSNAIYFSPQHSIVNMAITTEKKQLFIQVSDHGKGFSEKMLKHGKEQFVMQDESRTSYKQHGLGLYIADTIIKKYNGEIFLKNDTNGGVVEINLPVEI